MSKFVSKDIVLHHSCKSLGMFVVWQCGNSVTKWRALKNVFGHLFFLESICYRLFWQETRFTHGNIVDLLKKPWVILLCLVHWGQRMALTTSYVTGSVVSACFLAYAITFNAVSKLNFFYLTSAGITLSQLISAVVK